MTVHRSTVVDRQIQGHKKWLEKDELFPYEVRYEGRAYYQVRYYRFNRDKATGWLILDSGGTVVPFRLAKPVLRLFNTYNACMVASSTTLVRYIS
jgi:hypothetical protein